MRGKPFSGTRRGLTATVLFVAFLGLTSAARAQGDTAPTATMLPAVPDEGVKPIPTTPTGDGVSQVGCSSCGGGLLGYGGGGGCVGCGNGSGQCSPGRHECDCCCSSDTCLGRFVNGLYQCVCCPDPCYEPHWVALADAAFFTDAARPVTQMRIRIDQMWDMNSPDRAEYFWAQIGAKGPHSNSTIRSIDVSDFRLYTEAAAGRAGISIDMPYRRIEKDFDASGFSDMIIGTKAMLLDCQLMQITFGFKTYIPTGAPGTGLSTGHVGLEPSLIWALRLTPATYLQAQQALFIPTGGTPAFQGNVFNYSFSLNQILYGPCHDFQVIGTLELVGWEILNGSRTDGNGNQVEAKTNILSAGPGIRVVICDKIDFGLGSLFALTNQHWAEEMIRFDFRWRF
jgi:hypothetical protein